MPAKPVVGTRKISDLPGHISEQAVLDKLCINTIRTLSMDAVQQANSGHPGTPMALAPVIYTLWQDFLRFDPARPDLAQSRPLRAVLWTCLDAALFHAAPCRCESGQLGYECLGELAVTLDDIKRFPAARQQVSRAPGVPADLGRRDDDRAARPGLSPRASAWRSPDAGWRSTSIGPTSTLFDYDVYAMCGDGDMMEGVYQRGCLPRGSSHAREPVLDLRQQPHHDRGPHRSRLQRGRGGALSRLWLERAAGRRRQRHGTDRTRRSRRFRRHERRTDADHRRQPYRLRRTAQARYQRGPWRAAGR